MLDVTSNGDIAISPTIFTPTKPSTTPVLHDVSAGFSSIVQLARDVLINPDIAYRTDRNLQEQMLRDPLVMTPLLERKLMVAQLEFEVVPTDEEGNAFPEDKPFFPSEGGRFDAKTIAKKVENLFRRMQRQQDFFKQLLWADFRGTGVSELNWIFDDYERVWYPETCMPHHGDSITFDVWGNPRILTRTNQTGGRELSREERDRLIIHTYNPDMGFFFKGEEAGYRFHGRGLRDVIWPYWWLAHNATRFWVRFLQRFGMGFVTGRYPMGNKEAKQAIESVLQNLIEDSNVSIPVPADATDKDTYGIEFQTMPGVAEKASVFREFVEDWAGKHIRLILVGQEQANQTSGDGLGSGRAKSLSDTRRMYRDDSAIALAGTITEKVIKPLVRYNYGELPGVHLKFQFVLEKDDYGQQEKRVKAAKDAGLTVTRKWVHDALNIPQAMPGDDVIDFSTSNTPPGFPPMGGFGGGQPQLPAGENDEEEGKGRLLFDEAIRDRARYDDDGHWVTMEGAHVFIGKDGTVTKGPARLMGKIHGVSPKKKVVERERGSEKSQKAKWTSRLVGTDIQRYSEEHNEVAFSHVIGGSSLRDNEPVDIIVSEGGVIEHGVELKTMTDNKQAKIYMKSSAIAKKIKWMKANKAQFHTVVLDDQKVFNALGEGKHGPESARKIYYKRGFGSFRISNMQEVKDVAELKRLMATPTKELSGAASPSTYYPRVSK